ncbi:MAG: type III-B CRISPR module RAMP protein Cmr6 [Thermofilaceae archaeon]|nr:type III-B CRISPR module RAMP protein Cmr6 [Thermofilaceae archaeon]
MAMKSLDLKQLVEDCIRSYVEKYGLSPQDVNIVSFASKAFVECYLCIQSLLNDSLEDYISYYTRSVVENLMNAYTCKNFEGIGSELQDHLNSIRNSISALGSVFEVELETATRLLVHSRDPSLPLEVSLAWDPIRNVPYIPSSTLKGAARAYFRANKIETHGLGERELFGPESGEEEVAEGSVIFTDAYPVRCNDKRLLEADVMTPHYSEARYIIDEARASPIPIVFLTAAPKAVFKFLLIVDVERLASAGKLSQGVSFKAVFDIVNDVVKGLEIGLGAKTSVGYGRLKKLDVKASPGASRQ